MEKPQLDRLRYTLEYRSLSGFERDPELKGILAGLSSRPVPDSVAQLEGFLIDNKLLAEAPSERVSVQEIKQEDIKLIAYGWLV